MIFEAIPPWKIGVLFFLSTENWHKNVTKKIETAIDDRIHKYPREFYDFDEIVNVPRRAVEKKLLYRFP